MTDKEIIKALRALLDSLASAPKRKRFPDTDTLIRIIGADLPEVRVWHFGAAVNLRLAQEGKPLLIMRPR
jgi:hypothetical protein